MHSDLSSSTVEMMRNHRMYTQRERFLPIHLKQPTERDFDTWLTTIPDEELQLFSRITDQAFTDHAKPSETLTHILALIMHFHGKAARRYLMLVHIAIPKRNVLNLEYQTSVAGFQKNVILFWNGYSFAIYQTW